MLQTSTIPLAALSAERRQAKEHQDLLIAELDRRVKNVLARVAAVGKQASSLRQARG